VAAATKEHTIKRLDEPPAAEQMAERRPVRREVPAVLIARRRRAR
jgi:hypothetical protein